MIFEQVLGHDNTIRFTVHPEEIWTLTTLTIGTKGKPKIPSPSKASFPLPFTQIFDDEQIPSPPKFWYDQMGAFEIAAEAHGSNNQVMRQVSPVWPACWGYSCTGPTTYFGAQEFQTTTVLHVSIDVKLETEDAAFTLFAGSVGVTLNSRNGGSFNVGNGTKGTAMFTVGTWHTVELSMVANGLLNATLDGVLLGSSTNVPSDKGLYFKVQFDSYIYAQLDNWKISQP